MRGFPFFSFIFRNTRYFHSVLAVRSSHACFVCIWTAYAPWYTLPLCWQLHFNWKPKLFKKNIHRVINCCWCVLKSIIMFLEFVVVVRFSFLLFLLFLATVRVSYTCVRNKFCHNHFFLNANDEKRPLVCFSVHVFAASCFFFSFVVFFFSVFGNVNGVC